MYEMIKRSIEAGGYDLRYMIGQIDQCWLERSINSSERDELIALARERADPTDSYAPIEQRVISLETALRSLESRVDALENSGTTVPSDPSDEWPEYVQPTGAHDTYNTGDKITFNGKHYVCKMNGCVWSPADYPAWWEKVE